MTSFPRPMLSLLVGGHLPPCCASRNVYTSLACGKYLRRQWTLRNDAGCKRRFHYPPSRLLSLVSSYFTSESTSDYLWRQVLFLILQVEDTCSASTAVRMVLVISWQKKKLDWDWILLRRWELPFRIALILTLK